VGGACAYDHSDYGIAILMRTTKTPTFLGGWPLPGGGEARRVMCLKSSSFRGSKPLVACNTHITTNASDRPGQVKFVVKKAKSYNAGNRVVVGGDFNAYPYSDDMDVMYNGAYSPSGTGPFAEADLPYRGDRNSGYEGSAYNEYTSCGDQDPVCDGTFGDHANRKIDYIFLANGDWANYGADATKSTSSDHMLLWAWANIV
jgi:endonuclease/exonuclease/phosphatase family metal-dependent hydrolase